MAGTLDVILVLPQETDRLQDCLAARTPKVQRLPEYHANTPISTRECCRIAPPDHTTPWGVFGTSFYPIQWPPCSLRTQGALVHRHRNPHVRAPQTTPHPLQCGHRTLTDSRSRPPARDPARGCLSANPTRWGTMRQVKYGALQTLVCALCARVQGNCGPKTGPNASPHA